MTVYSIINGDDKTLVIYSFGFLLITLYLGIKYYKKTKNITLLTKLTYISFLIWNITLVDLFAYNILNSFFKTEDISYIFMLLTGVLYSVKCWNDLKRETDKEKIKEEKKNIIFGLFCIILYYNDYLFYLLAVIFSFYWYLR